MEMRLSGIACFLIVTVFLLLQAGSAAAEFVEGAGADVVPPPPHDAAETISAEISSDEITLFFIMILRSVCVLSVLFQLPIRFRRPRSVVYSCNHQGKRNICRL